MIVLDRSVDWVTPMCTQLTYEGLIDEIMGIKNCQSIYLSCLLCCRRILADSPSPSLYSSRRSLSHPSQRQSCPNTSSYSSSFWGHSFHYNSSRQEEEASVELKRQGLWRVEGSELRCCWREVEQDCKED